MAAWLLGTGCWFESDGPSDDEIEADSQADVDEYNMLARELEERRAEFLPEVATEPFVADGWVYWLEFRGFDPTLHRADRSGDRRIDYSFSIGSGNGYNVQASTTLVVTALPSDGGVAYRTYAADEPAALRREFSFPAPSAAQWWAYAVDGNELYVIVDDGDGQSTIFRDGIEVTSLEQMGIAPAEIWGFAVDGGRMVLVEGGRAWHIEEGTATSLGNDTEARSAFFEGDTLVLGTAEGPFLYDWQRGALEPLNPRIAAAVRPLNDTFVDAGLPTGEWTVAGSVLVYTAQTGIWAFDWSSESAWPVLLEPIVAPPEPRLVYRRPLAIDRERIIVQGLIGESGAVGAEGPIYRVDL